MRGATRRGSHLAGAEPRGDVPHTARRRGIRRRGADLVRQSGRDAAGQSARTVTRPHRAERRRSRCVDDEAARRRRGGGGTAVSAWRDARGNDRGAEQGGAGAGGGALRSPVSRSDGRHTAAPRGSRPGQRRPARRGAGVSRALRRDKVSASPRAGTSCGALGARSSRRGRCGRHRGPGERRAGGAPRRGTAAGRRGCGE